MGEIMQSWMQARLGLMVDLSPDVFGHYTKDGRLLAKILYSYDVISRDQLDTIIDTDDPALCRVNLRHLRIWLRFLGIDCDDESIVEISCGKGTTSLRLFYKVYLCLETKDRLHFITLQKEREKFVPTSKKFEVTTISEDPPPYQPPEHPLSRKLVEGKETVDWYGSKFQAILTKLKRDKEQMILETCDPYPIVQPIEYCVSEVSTRLAKGRFKAPDIHRLRLTLDLRALIVHIFIDTFHVDNYLKIRFFF
ncbi:uncharacterized protein LOC143344292 [Colletes latitarsis]|uniref:uncharacterized protein LOC143344292 n=1 Tax=Colletes latitarsis TaxID=2605962 RepID=UPI0040368A70